MDRILQFFGSALVRAGKACRVGFEIDLHVATGLNVSRLFVVNKVIAVNLVEAGGIFAVKNNTHVVQFGATVQFELLEVAGFDGKQGALAIGFGELKAIRGLLDVEANLVGDFLQHVAHAETGVEVCPRNHRNEQHGDHGQPAAEAVDGERHRKFSLIQKNAGLRGLEG